MELDNLIYIIITIVIFALSILSQFWKKKVIRPVQTEEPKYSLNDFEIILEKKDEYFKKEEDKLESIPEIEEVQDKEITFKGDKVPEESQKEQKNEEEFNDGFDIKSAIIYSSILERKKFRH